MKKLILRYEPVTGNTTPDGLVDDLVEKQIEILSSSEVDLEYSFANEIYLYGLRVAIKNGKIAKDNVQLIYKNQEIKIKDNGKLFDWPKGFCDYTDKYTDILLS